MARERVGNMATDPAATRNDARARLIHREIVQLLQLGVLAVAAFFVTRALAESNRDTTRRNGAEWYERGTQLLAGGEAERAVTAFRRAVVTNRQEPKYVLALAGALARQHQNDAARASLLALRESAPEHPEVNLQLARLAAARTDIAEAVRYYHSTLYAPWPREDEERRRQVRLELIDFLLRNGQTESGISELVALSTDVPDQAAAYVGLAARFVKAGDRRHALLQFQRALRLEPRNPAILAAAGQNAFELADYQLARRYFRNIVGGDPAVEASRELVDLILASDPLAPRIGAAERRRRLAINLTYAQNRSTECSPSAQEELADARLELQRRARLLNRHLRSRRTTDMDTIEDGVELVAQLEADAIRRCVPVARDRALLIIAQRHAADRR